MHKLLQPYLLRPLKTDKRIIADLLEKTELNRYCLLSREQALLTEMSNAQLFDLVSLHIDHLSVDD